MVKTSDFAFLSSDGHHQIACTVWEPEGPVRGTVQLVHGVAEYIGRYHDYACFLAEHGYAVAGDDHLGHGRTAVDESELGWLAEADGWEHMVRDEKKLRDILQKRFPGAPAVLFGHSMGSFIARDYLMRWPGDHTACVLSGTGHQPAPVCVFGKALSRLVARTRGGKHRSPLLQKLAFGSYLKRVKDPIGANDWICRDETVIRAYDADPRCGYTATAGLMGDMMTGLGIIGSQKRMGQMDKALPVLFIAGSDDPVGGYGKGVGTVADRFRRAGMTDVTVKLYDGFRHEVLNELGKETVWNDTLQWFEEKI